MTTIRLALFAGDSVVKATFGNPTLRPGLLVSYMVLRQFERLESALSYEDWVLDSGAFSAHTKGRVIELDEFIATAKRLRALPGSRLSEVFALDVINNWRASHANTKRMWAAGVDAIPCYHQGEPWSVLVGLARDYPKIAIGGMVGVNRRAKLAWVKACFDKVWPKKIHGFGVSDLAILRAVPFHTVDATNWGFAPAATGAWRGLQPPTHEGPRPVGARALTNFQAEVRFYLRAQKEMRFLWRRELASLEAAHV